MSDSIERTLLYVLIVIVILISVADLFGLLNQFEWLVKGIPTITLLLLSLAIAYWLTTQKRELQHLQKIESLVSLSTIDAQSLVKTEEAMDYLASRFTEAEDTIRQAAIAPSLSPEEYQGNYDRTLNGVLERNNVKYRHLVVLDAVRWNRVKKFLGNKDARKYFVS